MNVLCLLTAAGLLLSAAGCASSAPEPAAGTVRFGAVADVQYCDSPEQNGARHYRRSKELLGEDVRALNAAAPDFVLNLGDLIDRGWESYDPVLAELAKLRMPVYSVAGNHDFSVPDELKNRVGDRLGQPAPYYMFKHNNWRFLALDTNAVSLYAHPSGSIAARHSREIISSRYPAELKHGYNGGYGEDQLRWIDGQLAEAEAAGEPVVLFQHCPMVPGGGSPAALDSDRLLELLDRHPGTVKLCLSGHHHPGGEFVRNNVLFKTVKGQVEAEAPTYIIVDLTSSGAIVHGFGGEGDSAITFKSGR